MASHAQDHADTAQARRSRFLSDGELCLLLFGVPAERAGRPAVVPGLWPPYTAGSALGSLASVAGSHSRFIASGVPALSSEPVWTFCLSQ